VLTRLIVGVVLAVLAGVVVAVGVSGHADPSQITLTGGGAAGVLQAAGLLFFAFAGYARIATLGEEVRDPARTIPRAIRWSLGITLAVYVTVAVTMLSVLGPELARSGAPLADAVRAVGAQRFEPVVRIGAAVAALGSLLSLILGVSRTGLAMARDGHLPSALAAVHPRFGVPHRAEVAVGALVAVVAAVADVRAAIGFSSFAVLLYYAITNASAWTLSPSPTSRMIPAAGLAGCLALVVTLPHGAAVAGLAVVLLGAAIWTIQRLR
jgi:APA family basic amino acid/polyamine antiporter